MNRVKWEIRDRKNMGFSVEARSDGDVFKHSGQFNGIRWEFYKGSDRTGVITIHLKPWGKSLVFEASMMASGYFDENTARSAIGWLVEIVIPYTLTRIEHYMGVHVRHIKRIHLTAENQLSYIECLKDETYFNVLDLHSPQSFPGVPVIRLSTVEKELPRFLREIRISTVHDS